MLCLHEHLANAARVTYPVACSGVVDLDKIDLHMEPQTEEPARQYCYIAKCREWVKDFERKNGRLPKTCVVNMGCQLNTERGMRVVKLGFIGIRAV